MADATTAAKARIDKALALLERRILDIRARPASAPAVGDDDLFAPRPEAQRIADLEAAGREAHEALTASAELLREIIAADRETG